MLEQPLFSQALILGAGAAIVGVWMDGDAATGREESSHLDILWIHQLNKVFHDDVHTVLVKSAMIAETEQIELQALALHHLDIWDISYTNLSKVGLTRDGA